MIPPNFDSSSSVASEGRLPVLAATFRSEGAAMYLHL